MTYINTNIECQPAVRAEKDAKPLQCVFCHNPVQNVCAPTHSLIQTLGSDERFMKSLRGVIIFIICTTTCASMVAICL